jgi:CheY-like chemotaxis protein
MLQQVRCLLIDDDIDDQEIFMLALKDIGENIKCTLANNSADALKILRESEPGFYGVIFLDLNMPRVNGRQCLAEIKKIPAYQKVPVVIYTTSSDPKDKIETKQLGASDFISKPSNIDLLAKWLSNIFKTLA